MKKRINFIAIILIAMFLILSQLSACTLINKAESAHSTYWNENSQGTIETNDLPRLQQEVPFIIILPKYLPAELKSSIPKFVKTPIIENQIADINIYYSSSSSNVEIHITETLLSEPLLEGVLAGMNPDYTAVELAGVQVLEKIGVGLVNRSGKSVQVSEYIYMWDRKNLHLTMGAYVFNQSEARKIIESMLK
jgi:hypothetical protein